MNTKLRKRKLILPVASGKGGTGKTFLTVNLGISLARSGYSVIIVDADFGAPNLHTYLQIEKPKHSISEFYLKEKRDLNEIAVKSDIRNLKYIAYDASLFGLANMPYKKRLEISKSILKLRADFILVDIGAGTHLNSIAMFNLSNNGILVIDPEKASRQDAFLFLKTALFRKIFTKIVSDKKLFAHIKKDLRRDKRRAFNINSILSWIIEHQHTSMIFTLRNLLRNYKPFLVVNKIKGKKDKANKEIIIQTQKELSIDLEILGYVRHDKNVEKAQNNSKTFFDNFPRSNAAKDISNLTEKIIELSV